MDLSLTAERTPQLLAPSSVLCMRFYRFQVNRTRPLALRSSKFIGDGTYGKRPFQFLALLGITAVMRPERSCPLDRVTTDQPCGLLITKAWPACLSLQPPPRFPPKANQRPLADCLQGKGLL